MAESAYQSKQSFWQKVKNSAKEGVRKGAPKLKAAAKVAGRKAMEGGRWAATEAFKAYKEGQNKPRGKGRRGKPSQKASSRTGKRRIVIEDF